MQLVTGQLETLVHDINVKDKLMLYMYSINFTINDKADFSDISSKRSKQHLIP